MHLQQTSTTIFSKKRNKLDSNICMSTSYSLLKKRLLEFIKAHPENIFNVPSSLGLTCLTNLHVALSHLVFVKGLSIFCLIHEAWYETVTKELKLKSTTLSTAHISCTNWQSVQQNIEKINPDIPSMNKISLT